MKCEEWQYEMTSYEMINRRYQMKLVEVWSKIKYSKTLEMSPKHGDNGAGSFNGENRVVVC